jgi:hypothetical protein
MRRYVWAAAAILATVLIVVPVALVVAGLLWLGILKPDLGT